MDRPITEVSDAQEIKIKFDVTKPRYQGGFPLSEDKVNVTVPVYSATQEGSPPQMTWECRLQESENRFFNKAGSFRLDSALILTKVRKPRWFGRRFVGNKIAQDYEITLAPMPYFDKSGFEGEFTPKLFCQEIRTQQARYRQPTLADFLLAMSEAYGVCVPDYQYQNTSEIGSGDPEIRE